LPDCLVKNIINLYLIIIRQSIRFPVPFSSKDPPSVYPSGESARDLPHPSSIPPV
jgi:hypothetical protein